MGGGHWGGVGHVRKFMRQSTIILIAALRHTITTAASQRRSSHAIDRTFTQKKGDGR